MNMKTMTAKEVKNAFGTYIDTVQHEPVVVTKRSRPVAVTFSMHDLPAIMDFAEAMKVKINAGIRAGLEDVEAGRTQELNADFIKELTQELEENLVNKKVV